ncbi:MAG TPA: PH domain-containing protein [Microlunatus sp.]|nr:PH domain-containing protein [Microlunatus sp.]
MSQQPSPDPPLRDPEPVRPTDEPTADPTMAGPAPVTGSAPASAQKETRRPHPLTPFIRGWLVLVAIAFAIGRQVIEQSDGGFRLGSLGLLLPLLGIVVVVAGIGGFVSWYFTRFVIDDEELRIETGALFKQSKKVPFERLQSIDIIQPLAARLFGLAELRLEAGAGGHGIQLRYLSQAEASRLRDYLLTRAHGSRASIADSEREAPASRFTDLGRADRPLVTVPAPRLLASVLLSSEFLGTALYTVVVLSVSFASTAFALTALVPAVLGLFSLISSRIVAMFNFTLAESGRGLRIIRGLTNLSSQSVPVNRIQGVRISQPLLWRSLGWYRIDIDILGYLSSEGDQSSQSSSVLLPVASAEDIRLALDRILPGVDPDAIELITAPRRARWVRPFDFWTLKSGMDDRMLITENGWLTHNRNIVPHAKSQSVRLHQGPLQRRLGLADVHVDTPKGPVHAVAYQMDAALARTMVLTQLDRARAARRADSDRAALPADRRAEHAVLDHFGVTEAALLGQGGEANVYAVDDDRVLRVYHSGHEGPAQVIAQLQGLFRMWADAPFQLPEILDTGERAGRIYTVTRRLSGQSLDRWLPSASPDDRRTALLSYLDAAQLIATLPAPLSGFARLVGPGAPQRFDSLGALLNAQLQPQIAVSGSRLEADVPGVAAIWDQLFSAINARRCRPTVVHGDYCPPNTYVTTDANGRPRITGVGDFSPHTLLADPMMDLAGAVIFVELERYEGAADDARWLERQAIGRWGTDAARWIAVYRRFYGFYFSSAYAFDEELYQWCRRQLTPLHP